MCCRARKAGERNVKAVKTAEDMEGYEGNKDINDLLQVQYRRTGIHTTYYRYSTGELGYTRPTTGRYCTGEQGYMRPTTGTVQGNKDINYLLQVQYMRIRIHATYSRYSTGEQGYTRPTTGTIERTRR